MTESSPNLQHVWKDLAAQRPDDIIVRIAVEGSQAGRTYRIGTLFRRASRLANALRDQLQLQPGARVIILADDPEEQTLAVTALWLARLVAVPVEVTAPDQALISLMAGADVKAVIFSPDSAAKVASLFGRARSVEHWIVSGTGKGVPKVPGMARLDDLITRSGAAGDNIDRWITDDDCPALVVLSSGSSSMPHGILFSQRQILAAAQAAALTYPLPTTQQHTWVGLPLKSLTGLIHCMVVPLFTQIPCIIDTDVTMKAFWDQVAADGITTALIDYPSLKVLHRRGLSKRLGGVENLTLRVFTSLPFSSDLIAAVTERLGLKPLTSYSVTECGGMVTAFPGSISEADYKRLMVEYVVPSSGVPVPGVDIEVVDKNGRPVAEEVLGEIAVRGEQVMTGYEGTVPGPVTANSEGSLMTGDEGFYVKDSLGRKHIFVTGRMRDVVERAGSKVNLARIESVLNDIREVEYGRVVAFPNIFTTNEIGAYVNLHRGAQAGEKEILAQLRAALDTTECPKVLVMGDRRVTGRTPRRDLLPSFSQYEGIDFTKRR